MHKDQWYNLASVVCGIGGPILAVFFFKKAVETAQRELEEVLHGDAETASA